MWLGTRLHEAVECTDNYRHIGVDGPSIGLDSQYLAGVRASVPRLSVTIEGITRVSATFIETNGLHVIWVPIVPVLLSGIALMAVRRTGPGPTGRRLLLWTISVVFLGFCALGLFSFGFLYLPVALALIIVAVTDWGRSRGARAAGRRG